MPMSPRDIINYVEKEGLSGLHALIATQAISMLEMLKELVPDSKIRDVGARDVLDIMHLSERDKWRGWSRCVVCDKPFYASVYNQGTAKYCEDHVFLSTLKRGHTSREVGNFSALEWYNLVKETGEKCLCCGEPGDCFTLEVDHVIPISVGGSNHIRNIQPLCKICNLKKGTETIDYRSKYANRP